MKKDKILIVEPNKKYAYALEKMLRKEGCEVKVVTHEIGVDVLVLAYEYDFIFMDIQLWNAIDAFFLRVVKNVVTESKIILTSMRRCNDEALKKAIKIGVYGCIHKPFKMDEVLGILGWHAVTLKNKIKGLLIAYAIVITALALSVLQPTIAAQGIEMLRSGM